VITTVMYPAEKLNDLTTFISDVNYIQFFHKTRLISMK
jgi:hypothetical protein